MLERLTPRAEQEAVIRQILEDRAHLCRGEVGSGKTLVGVEAVIGSGASVTLVVAPLNTHSGWSKTFLRQGGGLTKTIDGSKSGKLAFEDLAEGKRGVYLIGWERFRMYDWMKFPLDFVIADECFVAGTSISTPNGQRNIEDLREGDLVWGFDHGRHAVVESRVRATMSKMSDTVLPNGATANHPYFVHGQGYLPMADLTTNDEVYHIVGAEDSPSVRRVRQNLLSEEQAAVLQLQVQRNVSGKELDGRGTTKARRQDAQVLGRESGEAARVLGQNEGLGAERRELQGQGQEAHDRKQSNAHGWSTGEGYGFEGISGRDVSPLEWRQWDRNDTGRETAIRSLGLDHADRGANASTEGQGVSDTLQDRRSERRSADRGGVRWAEPPVSEETGAGSQEGRILGVPGVDSLEILEPRDRERFERLREAYRGGSQQVFNIETETGNYFAEGVLVHNCHRQANRKSSTHRAVLSTRNAEYLLGLSATPAGNKIEGLWTSIKWLWWDRKDIAPAFWPFVTKFLKTQLDPYQGKKIMGEKNPGAIWDSLPSKSYFPSPFQREPIIHTIEVDLLPAQRKIYDRFEKEYVVWLGENPLVADGGAVQRVRLRQIALANPSIRYEWRKVNKPEEYEFGKRETKVDEHGCLYENVEVVFFEDDAKSTKADAVIEVLNDLFVEKPEPVLIFTHSRRYATMLTLRLQAKGFNARQFVGGMSKAEREWKKENFGKEFDILVATIATIGEGVDGLQDVCRIEFWLSLEDNRILNTQAKGRLSRGGQTKTVQRYAFVAKNTIETKQLDKLESDEAQLNESFEVPELVA